ncbi:MAG: hypothetical protein E3J72_01005 [Planctomycetota bacterium]|nr:MAG: hypothetical protein E3J72_01005 [Planctomycetota bacterium]
MDHVEKITHDEKVLALIVRKEFRPEKTTFLTPESFNIQLGFVIYPENGEITPHAHKPLKREIIGTAEVLIVQKGKCIVDIYTNQGEPVASSTLAQGDILFLVDGGHGFRMLEDTVLLEVKQGPYIGLDEKERFRK